MGLGAGEPRLRPLSATSADDNVRAGSLYLARLLRDTGNVLALRARFGGI